MNWSRLKKSVVVALCIVVGDFFLLAAFSHHFRNQAPGWLMNAFHFIFWPFFITQHFFIRIDGDQPTHSEIATADSLDLIFFTAIVHILWSLLSRKRS